jgi:hypothetical protein
MHTQPRLTPAGALLTHSPRKMLEVAPARPVGSQFLSTIASRDTMQVNALACGVESTQVALADKEPSIGCTWTGSKVQTFVCHGHGHGYGGTACEQRAGGFGLAGRALNTTTNTGRASKVVRSRDLSLSLSLGRQGGAGVLHDGMLVSRTSCRLLRLLRTTRMTMWQWQWQ